MLDPRQARLLPTAPVAYGVRGNEKKGSSDAPFCTSHHCAPDTLEHHASKCFFLQRGSGELQVIGGSEPAPDRRGLRDGSGAVPEDRDFRGAVQRKDVDEFAEEVARAAARHASTRAFHRG